MKKVWQFQKKYIKFGKYSEEDKIMHPFVNVLNADHARTYLLNDQYDMLNLQSKNKQVAVKCKVIIN